MDPDEALAIARRAVTELSAHIDQHPEFGTEDRTEDAVIRLVDSFQSLDVWLSNDGFLPHDWKPEEEK